MRLQQIIAIPVLAVLAIALFQNCSTLDADGNEISIIGSDEIEPCNYGAMLNFHEQVSRAETMGFEKTGGFIDLPSVQKMATDFEQKNECSLGDVSYEADDANPQTTAQAR